MSNKTVVHQVDEVLPGGKLFLLGLQHVLVMYAGAVAVPLILGGVMKLPKDQVALLISADLFACGVVTLIQSVGIWKFGIRLPVMMGVTFASVSPMMAMAVNPEIGLLGIYGSVITAGIFGILVAPLISRLLPLFPPVVTGTIISVIGISLMGVGINWAAGGLPTSPDYGAPLHLGVAFIVLLVILLIIKYVKGFFANIAVLLGIIVGFIIAMVMGKVNFGGVAEAKWIALVYPFQFGMPKFDIIAILSMCLVMIVVMIESTGMFLALGEITDRHVGREDLTRGLADRRPRYADRWNLQHLPLHLVFAECRPGWRDRRAQPLGDSHRRRDPGRVRSISQDGPRSGLGAPVRAGRRRHRDVRHGGSNRHPHPEPRRFREATPEPVRGGNQRWHGHDPADLEQVLPEHAEDAVASAPQRHPACGHLGRHPERLFSRNGLGDGGPQERRCQHSRQRSVILRDMRRSGLEKAPERNGVALFTPSLQQSP